MELADVLDSKSSGVTRAGSSPATGTSSSQVMCRLRRAFLFHCRANRAESLRKVYSVPGGVVMDPRGVQLIAKQTMDYLRSVIRPGMKLTQVRSLCENKMLELGADSFWYWDIGAFVFSGDETAKSISGKEYITSDRQVMENDLITIDLSPQHNYIWGDYARTIILENGRVANGVEDIQNLEWREGLMMECLLHRELIDYVDDTTTFEALYRYMNAKILTYGFVNLDFLGNLGHSIEKNREDRIYIERGNLTKLSDVIYFTFEPHIARPNSVYGFKWENIYHFQSGKLMEL